MGLRSTYNSGVYNSGLYGEPETTQGAASAAIGVSASASAVTIVDGAASTAIAFAASQPTGVRVVDASASISLGGIVSVSAVKYEVIHGFRAGYGLNTYGSYIYGKNISIEEGSASANIAFAASVSGGVTRNVSASTANCIYGNSKRRLRCSGLNDRRYFNFVRYRVYQNKDFCGFRQYRVYACREC